MSEWTTNLITGTAELLAAAGVGEWRPNGPSYTANEVGILMRDVPPQPDRVITLAPSIVASPIGLADFIQGVQIRCRGTTDPRVCEDLSDQVFDLLDSASRLTLGGVSVVQVYRQSHTPLGKDGNGRWESSSNYYFEAMRPTVNRSE
ncbi:minor capsid protein [Dactylosporangium sp. CA-152071]|uniref:minor capsid protein n=1 Tax=Dactylosporangium sp. CA-152071 TaxID=3239933 RepID=UPI003D8CDC77